MMFMKSKLFLLTLFTTFTFLFAKANNGVEESTKKVDVAGGVYHSETKKPLSSVSVTVYSAPNKKEKIIYTDVDGSYTFYDLKAGTYKFVFEKEGFKKVVKEHVVVKEDEGISMNIAMTEHASFDYMPGPFHFSEF